MTEELPNFMEGMDAKKSAYQLHKIGMKVTDYEQGIQSERKRRLETFKTVGIPYLIECEEKLIAFGEQVINNMKVLNLMKFMHDNNLGDEDMINDNKPMDI